MSFPLELQTIFTRKTPIKLYVPDAASVQKAYANDLISFPYWSQVWPSSIALSEFIIDNSYFIQNKNLLELGAGLGLPSLIASRYAASVVCSDKEADAVDIIRRSAAENKINNLQAVVLDWKNLPAEIYADVLLLSDINYEPDTFQKLSELIFHFIKKGTTIVLATPQRLMAKSFVEAILQFCVLREELSVTHKQERTAITVLMLQDDGNTRE